MYWINDKPNDTKSNVIYCRDQRKDVLHSLSRLYGTIYRFFCGVPVASVMLVARRAGKCFVNLCHALLTPVTIALLAGLGYEA